MYERRCKAAASQITPERLRHFVVYGGDLDLDVGSHKIFIIRRNTVDNLEEAYIAPISPYVEMLLMTAIDAMKRSERIYLYRTFSPVNATRGVAGLVYESLGHTHLTKGITLTLKPMKKKKASMLFHWECREGYATDSMDLGESEMSVIFPPNPAVIYQKLESVRPNYLHVPKASNKPAFDSFFQLDGTLYFFQFTLSDGHSIKKISSAELDIFPPKENWRFVFVIPPNCEVDVKATSEVEEFLERVRIYTAHLEIEE